MKRVFLGQSGIFGFVSAALLAALFSVVMVGGLGATAQAQSSLRVNAFTIPSYDISYELGRDVEGRSTLKTTERITAKFTLPNTNRGIERAIPSSYKGHSVATKIERVADGNGQSVQYSTRSEDGMTILRIGNPDVYVLGEHTYEIIYSQRDVTHEYADTKKAEWYWDTNGTGWKVAIGELRVTAKINESIAGQLNGSPFCYQGAYGSTQRCDITGSGNVYTATASNLQPGQNMTLAFGFNQGTFAPYEKTLLEKLIPYAIMVAFAGAILGFIAGVALPFAYTNRRNRNRELKIVPVEYTAPMGVSVTTSAQITSGAIGSVLGAQLIDFAVRGYVNILETKPKGAFSPAQYDVVVARDVSGLLAEEQELLSDMFKHLPQVGERLALSSLRYDYGYASRTLDNGKKLEALILGEYGLRDHQGSFKDRRFFKRWGVVLLISSFLLLSPFMLIASIMSFSFARTLKPLTDRGLALRRYLAGLSIYIKAAEADRIKMLQGPDTAEKLGRVIDTGDHVQLVRLYEKVLPYAVLFGHEKKWAKQLGDLYAETQQVPDWYTGASAFSAATFVSAISSMSYSAGGMPTSSSSSGGSSGGGSSGGGGGGGGGGGW